MADHRLQIILAAKDITGTAFTKFKGELATITKSVFSLRGAIGTLAGTTGLGLLVTKSLAAADALGKTAAKLGISTDALQEYQYGAELSGVSTETLNMALQRFTRRTAEAAQGKGELKDVLKQYNIAVKDAAGNTRRTEDVLADLADVMQRTDNRAERLRIAFKAFDSEGAALVNMLKDGSGGLDAFRDKAQALGLVIDKDLIANSEKANDELATLGKVLKTQVTSALVSLAPQITKTAGSMLDWVEANNDLIRQDIQKTFTGIAAAIGKVADAYKSVDAFLSVNKPESYLEAYREQLEMNLKTQQAQLDMYKRLGSEGSAAYDKLNQRLALTRDHLSIVRGELIDRDLLKFFTGVDSPLNSRSGGAASRPPRSGAAATTPAAVGLAGARWSPRGSRGAWAPRAGGMVGIEEIQKDALDQMTANNEQAFELMDGHVTAYYDNLERQNEKAAERIGYFADRMSSAFADFVTTGKFSFKDFTNSIINDLIRIQTRALLTNIFSSAAGSGGFLSGLLTTNAAGGVYGSNGPMAFARGGVVDRPTVFPFAAGVGLMGEAGPEAILPLARTSSGNLGVEASGRAVTVNNFYITAMDALSIRETLKRSGAVEHIVTENLSSNGIIRKSIMENI